MCAGAIVGILFLGAGISAADQRGGPPERSARGPGAIEKIAVLPFAAPRKSLEMYGKPVADAVARALSQALPPELGIEVVAISLTGDVPTDLSLVIDGRIVQRGEGGMALEAQVRDPRRGVRLATLATKAGSKTDLDQLSGGLGRVLAARVVAMVRAGQDPGAAVPAGPDARVSPDGEGMDRAQPGDGGAHPNPAEPGADDPDDRPVMVVFRVTGKAERDMADVGDIATEVIADMARDLGYRPRISERAGILYLDDAGEEVRALDGQVGLMLDVRRVDFDRNRVLLARGRFRAVLVDASGARIYDGKHGTDTLVGSRGDGHAALVRFVMNQAVDILRPRLGRALRARAAGGR